MMISLKIIIICIVFGKLQGQQRCSSSYCNYEGTCEFLDGLQKKCICVPNVAKGDKCEEFIELCAATGKGMCKMESTCKSFPGGFNCECKPGFHSYYCNQDIKDVIPLKDPIFTWNRVIEVNKNEVFLLTTSQNGNLLYNIVFSPFESCGKHELKSDDMKKSANLRKVCQDNGLKKCSHLPEKQEGFYAIFKNNFKNVQKTTCSVKMLHSVPTFQVLAFMMDFYFEVIEEISQKCFPKVFLSGGHTKENPIRLRGDLASVIAPIVQTGCSDIKTSFTFEYQMRSLANKLLYKFPIQITKNLMIEPYQLSNFVEDELFMMVLKVTEVVDETGDKEMTEVNIYVHLSAPLQALIEGGLLRQVKQGRSFILNGKGSRDLMLLENIDQKLKFHWSCKSEDYRNNFCDEFSSREQETVIPKHVLNLGQSYIFQLIVSKHNRDSSESQTIQIVEHDPLYIEINCIKNCKEKKSNIENFIHLQAVCRNCFDKNKQIEYEWMLSKNIIGEDSRLIYEFDKELPLKEFDFEVNVKYDERTGKNIFKTEISLLWQPINCEVVPKEGTALVTPFKITCNNNNQEDEILTMQIYQNDVFILDAQFEVIDIFLIDLGQVENDLKVVIKNMYGVKEEKHFKVKLEEFAVTSTINSFKQFIDNPNNYRSIQSVLIIGDHVQAITIFNSIVAKINQLSDNDERLQIVEKMLTFVEILPGEKKFNPLLLISALQHLSEKIDAVSQISSKISEILVKTTSLLINMNEDEIIENAHNTIEIINKIVKPFDAITEPYDDYIEQPDEPFTEHYPDYDALEVNVIDKYMNLEKLVLNGEKIMETLTEAFVTVMNPLEPAMVISSSNSKHYFRIINSQSSTALTNEVVNALRTRIELNEALLNTLNKNEDIKIGIGISRFRNNLYWWYPNKNLKISQIHIINLVKQNIKNPDDRCFIHKLEHPIKVFTNIAADLVTTISGTVEHVYDMPSYKFLVNMNETLDFRFNVMPEDSFLKVGFTSNYRPKYREIISQNYEISNEAELMYFTENSNSNTKENFIHMGLVSNTNNSIEFNFSSSSLSCLEWDKETSHWSTVHSVIGNKINETYLECQFSHLSSIGISQNKPLVKQHPIRTFPHVLVENQVVLYLIAFLLLIFMTMITWGFIQDRKDDERRTAIIVGDNSPLHSYEYLIVIQTGSDREAGTSSCVGIQLFGDIQSSQKHLLRSSENQQLFERFRESSFVIRTSAPLGKINRILVWHDNKGTNPSWYCYSIIVRDIKRKQEFPFLVEQWISVLKTDETFAYIELPTKDYFYNNDTIMRHNQMFVMQNHVWPYNLLYKHCRSNVARTEIILCGFQQLLVSMLVNIALYGKSTKENLEDEAEEYDHFGHYWTIILYSVISLGFCMVINYPMKYLMQHSSWSRESNLMNEVKYQKVFIDQNDEEKSHDDSRNHWSSEIKILWYILNSIICFTSIAIIIIYGYHFGNIKCLMWTISVCIQIAKTYFVTAPIFTYIGLHYFPRNTKERFSYHMPSVIKKRHEKIQSKLEILRIHSASKVKRFNDKCYVISSGLTKNTKKLTYQKYELRELVSDLVMFLTFFVTLNVLILGTRDSNTYYSAKMVESMFVNGLYSQMRLHDVRTDLTFWKYMNKTLIPVMHSGTQYNKIKIKRDLGWLLGRFSKVLGVAQIRQIRVKNTNCTRPNLTQQNSCQSKYSKNLRDTENYFPNWTTFQAFSYETAYWRLIQPWKYKAQSFFQSPPIFSGEHWYSGGGYVASLGRTYNNSQKITKFLKKYNWIDARTRVVLVEFTIYNADADIFNVINLMFERNAVGQWHTSSQIQSCKFLFRFNSMGLWFIIVFVLFVILTGAFLLKLILKIMKETIGTYIRNIWNLTDTIIVAMSIVIVMLFVKRNDYVENLIKNVERTKNNEFISFSLAAMLDTVIAYVSGILICVATIRLWKILLFAQVFRLFTNTLYHASYALISCGILILIFLFGYSGCIYLINGTNAEVFHNFLTVLPAITAVSFGMEPFDFENIMYGGETLGIILFILMFAIISLFLVNMVITIIMFYFQKSKDEEQKRLYTLRDYIKDRTKSLINPFARKKLKSNLTEMNRNEEKTNKLVPGKINEVADTIDAQLTYLEEYFKDFNRKKKIQTLKYVKTLHKNISTQINALRINIEAKITVYEDETDTDSSQEALQL